MKIYEIAAPKIMHEGMVEPNVMLSIKNVVQRGKATNHFEFMMLTRLLQMMKAGNFDWETNPFDPNMSTDKELIDMLRAMPPAKLVQIASMLLGALETKDANCCAQFCNPGMSYIDWIKLFQSHEANQ